MPHHKSAQKRLKQTQLRTLRIRSRMNRIRTFVKKVETAIQGNDYPNALNALRGAQPEIHRGISKGILHRNTGARKLQRLSKRVKELNPEA